MQHRGISVSDIYDDWIECWQCGGEGEIASCQDEIGCVDPESGCDLCMRRCDICNGKRGWKRDPEPTDPAAR